jgi:hypothetical protein
MFRTRRSIRLLLLPRGAVDAPEGETVADRATTTWRRRRQVFYAVGFLLPLALAYALVALLTGSAKMHRFCGELHKGMTTAQVYATIDAHHFNVGPSAEDLEDAAWVHDPESQGVHLCRLNFDGLTLMTATYELTLFDAADSHSLAARQPASGASVSHARDAGV